MKQYKSKQFPVLIQQPKKWALYEGNTIRLSDVPYSALVAKERELINQGIKKANLRIRPL